MFKRVLVAVSVLGGVVLAVACSAPGEAQTGEQASAETMGECQLVCTWKQIQNDAGYIITYKECHAACNRLIDDNPKDIVGACVCTQNGGDYGEYTGHTGNWYLKDPTSANPQYCIVEPQLVGNDAGRSSECCWPAEKNDAGQVIQPPNTGSGDGQACLKWLCGDQYTENADAGRAASKCNKVTDPLPKPPMATDCRAKTKDKPPATQQAACNTCCDEQGHMWDFWINSAKEPQKSQYIKERDEFIAACKAACNLTPKIIEDDAGME
jgi:hypothetical protein